MATLWSVRTGLELLDGKLARWNDSSVTKQDASVVLEHSLNGEVNVASADGDSRLDLDFARQVLSQFFERGETAHACEIDEVRHCGAVFGKRS
eukprot:4919182-Pleurochrysis_carterae.AAC.1